MVAVVASAVVAFAADVVASAVVASVDDAFAVQDACAAAVVNTDWHRTSMDAWG